tara:strand:- start:25603 stop:25914 length:312 start_codon:yes stop_codon:yes gene_type:complete
VLLADHSQIILAGGLTSAQVEQQFTLGVSRPRSRVAVGGAELASQQRASSAIMRVHANEALNIGGGFVPILCVFGGITLRGRLLEKGVAEHAPRYGVRRRFCL